MRVGETSHKSGQHHARFDKTCLRQGMPYHVRNREIARSSRVHRMTIACLVLIEANSSKNAFEPRLEAATFDAI